MPDPDTQSLIAATAATLGHEDDMRQELAEVIKEFMADVELPNTPVAFSADPDLVALADFAARARSPIERDTHYS